MAHDGKKKFSVFRGAHTQGQKDTLSLKWMNELVKWCVFNTYVLAHVAFVEFEHSVCLGSLVQKAIPFSYS